MNVFNTIRGDILESIEALAKAGKLAAGLDASKLAVEPPREAAHGDVSTNAALVLSKPAGLKPRDFASLLVGELKQRADVESAEIAGPGFINLRLTEDYWRRQLTGVLKAGEAYGASTIGAGRAVNVEYVSANPTGPMH